MELAPQQWAAVKGSLQDVNTTIKAFAGTGKSTTLRAIGERRTGSGLYIVFNKANQRDAERTFPRNVTCRTVHALAYRAIVPNYLKAGKKVDILRTGDILRFNGWTGAAATDAWNIGQTLTNYCASGDTEISWSHIPEAARALLQANAQRRFPTHPRAARAEMARFGAHYVNGAKILWTHITDAADKSIPLTHDAYLKLWSLSGAQVGFDYILLDEAQDTNPCVIVALANQRCPVLCVGDPHQAIYGWRGAVNAMDAFKGQRYSLTETYRFGAALEPGANAMLMLLGDPERLIGKGPPSLGIRSINAQTPHTRIVRTNAMASMEAMKFCTEVPTAVVGDQRPFIELLTAGYALMTGGRGKTTAPALVNFKDWGQFAAYTESVKDGELRVLREVLENYGRNTTRLISILQDHLVPEKDAQIVVTTAHRAKGREWDHVVLCDDFGLPVDKKGVLASDEELNLLYVAATRARKSLQPNPALEQAMSVAARITRRVETART